MVGAGAGARRYSGTETDTSVDQSEDYMVLQVRASLQSSSHCHCLNGKCQLSITKLSLRETYEEEEYNEELLLNLILFR